MVCFDSDITFIMTQRHKGIFFVLTAFILVYVLLLVPGIATENNYFYQIQTNICTYRSLCTRPNETRFDDKKCLSTQLPCCTECSCDHLCVIRGNCCPDFGGYVKNEHVGSKSLESMMPNDGQTNVADSELECVRTQHGLLNVDDGYEMIASCPRNYTNNWIRAICENSSFDIVSLYNHVPISNTVNGRVFKNEFCKICTDPHYDGDDDEYANKNYKFWQVWFACAFNPIFQNVDFRNPVELVQNILHTGKKKCGVLFKLSNESRANSTKTCLKEKIIDTCADEFINTDSHAACMSYTWPIMHKRPVTLEKYKNYACMVCNGIKFDERCVSYDYKETAHFSATLNIEIPELRTSNEMGFHQTLNQVLSADNGSRSVLNVQDDLKSTNSLLMMKDQNCRYGFVYDYRKGICRQIFCPNSFFVKDGKCKPLFVLMNNVVYSVLLDIRLPNNFNNTIQYVVATVFSNLTNILEDRLGTENYELSLWTNSPSSDLSAEPVMYVVLLNVHWKFAQGNFSALLEFVHQLVNVERSFPVGISSGYKTVTLNVGISFAVSVKLVINNKGRHLSCIKNRQNTMTENLSLVKHSPKWKFASNTLSYMEIGKTSFCYMVLLSEDEFIFLTRGRTFIEIVFTKQILISAAHIRTKTTNFGTERSYYTCINDILSNIDETTSYIMKATVLDNVFEASPDINTKTRTSSAINFEKPAAITDQLSSIALVASCAFIAIVIFIKRVMERLQRNERIVEYIANDTVNVGTNENIQMNTISQTSSSIRT